MGSTESTQAIYVKQWNKIEQLKYSYIFHNSIEIYESQSNQLYALTMKHYNSDFYYIKELKRLEDYQKLHHIKGLISILDIQKKEESTLCSKMYQIQTTFQYGVPITMNNIQWDQFLMQAVTILIQLKDKQVYHNDITLQSFLLIDNQLHLTLPIITQYMKIVTNQNKLKNNIYLCPELCSNFLKKQYNPLFDREKADVYSLGLICLELCLKQSIQSIYTSDLSINQLMLDQLIDQSKMLIIQKMLTLKIEDRPDFKYLFEACLYEQTQLTLKSRISPQVLKSLQLKSRVLQQSFNEPMKIEQTEVTRSINFSHHTPKAQSTKAAYSTQCFFLHERIHIPISPGENYLGSSTPQQKKRKIQTSYSKRSSSKRKNKNICL